MKKLITSIALVVAAAATVHAGTAADKLVTPTTSDIGTGLYGAVQGGVNVFQNGIENYGWINNRKAGWEGGLKLGYVMNTSCLVRPAVELEGFYNAFDRHLDEPTGAPVAWKYRNRSFAIMANGIAKFNLGVFQPYAGAGIGYFKMRTKVAADTPAGEFDLGSASRDGFAWQLLAGSDYYFTPKFSLFAEYKWLNYEIRNSSDYLGDSRIGQQIVSLGARYHF